MGGGSSGTQEEILKDYDFKMKVKVEVEILLKSIKSQMIWLKSIKTLPAPRMAPLNVRDRKSKDKYS